jgi:hypothetical protein
MSNNKSATVTLTNHSTITNGSNPPTQSSPSILHSQSFSNVSLTPSLTLPIPSENLQYFNQNSQDYFSKGNLLSRNASPFPALFDSHPSYSLSNKKPEVLFLI